MPKPHTVRNQGLGLHCVCQTWPSVLSVISRPGLWSRMVLTTVPGPGRSPARSSKGPVSVRLGMGTRTQSRSGSVLHRPGLGPARSFSFSLVGSRLSEHHEGVGIIDFLYEGAHKRTPAHSHLCEWQARLSLSHQPHTQGRRAGGCGGVKRGHVTQQRPHAPRTGGGLRRWPVRMRIWSQTLKQGPKPAYLALTGLYRPTDPNRANICQV